MNADQAVQPSQVELPIVVHYSRGAKIMIILTLLLCCAGFFSIFTGRIPALQYLNPTLLGFIQLDFIANLFMFPYMLWFYTRTVVVTETSVIVNHLNGIFKKEYDRSNILIIKHKQHIVHGESTIIHFRDSQKIKLDAGVKNRAAVNAYFGLTS